MQKTVVQRVKFDLCWLFQRLVPHAVCVEYCAKLEIGLHLLALHIIITLTEEAFFLQFEVEKFLAWTYPQL